jgi:hypothetical protein
LYFICSRKKGLSLIMKQLIKYPQVFFEDQSIRLAPTGLSLRAYWIQKGFHLPWILSKCKSIDFKNQTVLPSNSNINAQFLWVNVFTYLPSLVSLLHLYSSYLCAASIMYPSSISSLHWYTLALPMSHWVSDWFHKSVEASIHSLPFWIPTPENDDKTLISISKGLKIRYTLMPLPNGGCFFVLISIFFRFSSSIQILWRHLLFNDKVSYSGLFKSFLEPVYINQMTIH